MPKLNLNSTTKSILMILLVGALFLTSSRETGPLPVVVVTWFATCLAAEILWHRSLNGGTTLTMAPAAHLAAVATLPPLWGILVPTLTASLGSVLWGRSRLRSAWRFGGCAAVASGGALFVLLATGVHASISTTPLRVTSLLQDPGRLVAMVGAGLVYLALSQGLVAWATSRKRGVGILRAWRDAFGYETELVTSAALLIVALLAFFCFQTLGYRGILLCLMPILFVRDGSRRYIELDAAQGQVIENERLAAKGEMAAEIGHELNNYLAAISGRAQLLLRNIGAEARSELAENARRIRDLATQMAELSKGLMDFSHRDVKRTAFGISELVEKTIDFVRPQTRFRTVDFQLEASSDLPPVEMDPGQIQQVLMTLFGRAADRPLPGPGNRPLAIRIYNDERKRTVGIELRLPAHPFGADGQKEAPPELGTVRRIVERHQGRFETDQEGEGGEVYRVLLPAA